MKSGIRLGFNVHVRRLAADGTLLQEERVHNIATDVGCAHIADQLASVHDEDEMSHLACGTGVAAPAAGDTALGAETAREALTSRVQGAGAADHTDIYSGSFTGITGAITEAGILNAAVAGTLLVRATFGAKNMAASETLAFDWTLSVADDGV